jgi:hypothetical protein
MKFCSPANSRAKDALPARRTQSAAAFFRETRMSPLSTVSSQRSIRLPSTTSKRALPLALPSNGSCPRLASSAKNSAVASEVTACTGGGASDRLPAPLFAGRGACAPP